MYIFHEWRSYLAGTKVFWINAAEQSVNTDIYQWSISTEQKAPGRVYKQTRGQWRELNALHME